MNKIVAAGVLGALGGLALIGSAVSQRRSSPKAAVETAAEEAPAPAPFRRDDWDRRVARPAPERRAPTPETPPSAPAEPQPQTPAEVTASLNAAFEADRPADAAAANTRVAIATAFRDPKAKGAELRDVDCRATRCRLSVEFTDKGADKRVLSDFFQLLGAAGVDTKDLGFTVPEREVRPDGSIAATIHLYRDDVPL